MRNKYFASECINKIIMVETLSMFFRFFFFCLLRLVGLAWLDWTGLIGWLVECLDRRNILQL